MMKSASPPLRSTAIGLLLLGLCMASHAWPASGSKDTANVDWSSLNFDIHNSRYSSADKINVSNVGKLALQWSYDLGDPSFSQGTPLEVSGVMYFAAGPKFHAVDGATGKDIWTFETQPPVPLSRRGPAYGDGRIYAYSRNAIYAIDAKTGKLVETFGDHGKLSVLDSVVRRKYPNVVSCTPEKPNYCTDTTGYGYSLSAPPTYYNGTLYFDTGSSDATIPGGLVVAVDGSTGAIKWIFSTVPHGPEDDGWDIAKDTWVGGVRAGGGMWSQPAIDSDAGLIYVNTGNPSPVHEGTARLGDNLFTNAILALHMDTGKLAWYYQTVHHDLWDWDLITGPLLFDLTSSGRTIKGVAAGGKNCLMYAWDRENGKPINPMVETPVPTETDVPGEHPSPTQPFPFTAKGVPQQPYCATYPMISDPELAKRARPMYTPFSAKTYYILSHGGGSFGSPSFSPRTGLLYITGKNAATSHMVQVAGDKLRAGDYGFTATLSGTDNNTGVTPTETVTAYDPITGEMVWQEVHSTKSNIGSGGNFATAGDLVFQGNDEGELLALDARSGKVLFKSSGANAIKGSPMTYEINGRQYVAVVATNKILSFALANGKP